MNEPVADQAGSILDGHIVLSRQLAQQNHYPAIDILNSVSRVMLDLVDREHRDASQQVKEVLAVYRQAQDLIDIGAYSEGNNAKIDWAIRLHGQVIEFLRQDIEEHLDMDSCVEQLKSIAKSN